MSLSELEWRRADALEGARVTTCCLVPVERDWSLVQVPDSRSMIKFVLSR